MRIRIIAGFVALPLLFFVLYFAHPVVLPLSVSVLSVMAVQELLWGTGFVRQRRVVVYAAVLAALVAPFEYFDWPDWLGTTGLFLFALVMFTEGLINQQRITFSVISASFFAGIIFPLFLSSVIRIHDMPHGAFVVLFPFLAAFGSDIGAYFVGSFWGKRKLIPEISPKKTVEGSFGGLLGSLVVMLIFSVIVRIWFGFTVAYERLLVYALLGAAAGQLGDLSMSFVKREFHIKDFGTIMPGHGGILDRFDSVMFAAPLMEALLSVWPVMFR